MTTLPPAPLANQPDLQVGLQAEGWPTATPGMPLTLATELAEAWAAAHPGRVICLVQGGQVVRSVATASREPMWEEGA